MTWYPEWAYKNVVYLKQGARVQGEIIKETGWYFYDEAGLLYGGPYFSRNGALTAVVSYAESL